MAKKSETRPHFIKEGLVAHNRRARYDYEMLDEQEAGLVLTGTEVKSLRNGKAQINEAYVTAKEGELWLLNASIAPYAQGNRQNHEEKRPRKCLMNRRQINKWSVALEAKGMTIVPIKLYFNQRGVAKILLGLGKGKKSFEKRETIKERDWSRQKAQMMRK
jgi:SsrA-binding protein